MFYYASTTIYFISICFIIAYGFLFDIDDYDLIDDLLA